MHNQNSRTSSQSRVPILTDPAGESLKCARDRVCAHYPPIHSATFVHVSFAYEAYGHRQHYISPLLPSASLNWNPWPYTTEKNKTSSHISKSPAREDIYSAFRMAPRAFFPDVQCLRTTGSVKQREMREAGREEDRQDRRRVARDNEELTSVNIRPTARSIVARRLLF